MIFLLLIAVVVGLSLFGNGSKAEQVELGESQETMACGCVVKFMTKRTRSGYESQSRGHAWMCSEHQAMEDRLVEVEKNFKGYAPRKKKQGL